MDKIGPYQILDVLHRGPRPLYKVKAADGRSLALKVIAVSGLSDEMRERFMREAGICQALDHPNLVRVYDAGEADGMLYQAMDLLEGADLNTVLSEHRQFTWSEKLFIMEQACEGLQYAHDRKMVHRDIKPANLFLENSGRLRVLDFGMARIPESTLTKVGSSVGTLNYMSPEQIRGLRCTSASDVFSAGIVFYQLATGRHPFSSRDRSLAQVVSAIVFDSPPKIAGLCPDAPEGLEFILDRALQKEADKRTQNAGDLKQALSLCRITMELAAAADQSPAPPARAKDLEREKPVEEQKTRVMRRAGAPNPGDAGRHVEKAPKPSPVPVAPVPATPAAPAQRRAATEFRFCSSCTFANPSQAVECQRCGLPLVTRTASAKPDPARPWILYLAVSVAVLLAVILIVVLIVK